MTDNDLIRRGDAIAVIVKAQTASCTCLTKTDDPSWHRDGCKYRVLRDVEAMIAHVQPVAIPAAEVAVKPLEWVDFADRGAKAQAWNDANYMIQKWSDGRWEISASYPGYSTSIYGMDRFHPTLEAAKAAAQADYDARIMADLDVQSITVQDAARDADLLLSAYSAVIVLHRMLRRAGLARGIAVARKIADEIVAAHPEFPGLTALRAITEGRE